MPSQSYYEECVAQFTDFLTSTNNERILLYSENQAAIQTADPALIRSIKETLIRSFAIHFVAAATVGHLLLLRNFTYKRSATLLFYIVGFLLFPFLPIAQLLRQLRSTIALSFHGRRQRGLTFYASACCGMHIAKPVHTTEIEPIIKSDPNRIHRCRAPYNAIWLGRVVVLVVLIMQYCGTSVLWFRRAWRSQYGPVLWNIDTRNLEIALGGLAAVLCSLFISLINTEWKIGDHLSENGMPLSDRPVQDTASISQDMTTSSEAAIVSSVGDRVQESMEQSDNGARARALLLLSKIKHLYSQFRAISLTASNATCLIYPLELQWDLELAFLLRMFFGIFVPMQSFNNYLLGNTRDYLSLYMISVRIKASIEYTGLYNSSAVIRFMVLLYLLPSFTILLHYLLWLVASTRLVRFVTETVGKIVSEVDFWFRSGRTVFSIPLSILMFLPVYWQILFIKLQFGWLELAKSYVINDGLADFGSLWKDPLADQLYII